MSDEKTTPLRRWSAEPRAGSVRPFDPPEVETADLEGGLALRLVGRPRLPVVAMTLVLDAGEAAVLPERAGLALLAGRALEGGTERRDGAELAEALEGLGTELRVRAGWDATTISLTCLADRLGEAMALLSEVARRPSFPPAEVQRVVNEHRAMLKQRRMDPASLAQDAFVPVVYDSSVPYSRPLSGSEATLEGVDSETLRRFVTERYLPGGGGLVVAGDADPGEVRELANEHFGGWDGKPPAAEGFRVAPAETERRVVVVHRPGAVQSEIRIGHVGVPRRTPDYHAVRVANTILGGAFTSRLNLNLRERNGFTYGVRSRFAFRREAGPFSISTAVSTEVTADAIREAIFEVQRLVREGPEAEEVERAKDYIAGVFPLQFETASQVAAKAAELLVYGLPEDHHREFRDRIRGVTLPVLAEVVRTRIRPSELQILVVGDAEAIRGPLEALELGPLEVRAP